jgi:hypothetical protein
MLHILNGDSTKAKFGQTGIKGQIMVWREVLVQGPLFYQVDSELFWDMRAQFMEVAFDVKLSEYKKKSLSEFAKLRRFTGDEIVLWFEHDLFCQINLVALLSYILRNKKDCKVSLVCVGDYPGYEKRVGLGQIPTEDYLTLYEERAILEKKDLLVADRAWMLFCGKQLDNLSEIKSDRLIYLKDALTNARQIFSPPGKLSALEKEILSIAKEEDKTNGEIIGKLLKEHDELGFGDLQYEYILRTLGSK